MGLVVEDFLESSISGKELNEELYHQALQQAHPLVLETHAARGRALAFAPDR